MTAPPSEAEVLEVMRRHGIDAATEFLYRRLVERHPPSPLVGEGGGEGKKLTRIEARVLEEGAVERRGGGTPGSLHVSPLTPALSHKGRGSKAIIIPGAFHEEYTHTGADGERMMKLAESLGFTAERVPLPSLAPMAKNAETILDFLSSEPTRPTILLSLSKGSADLRTALERPDAAGVLQYVRAWINLSGIVTPTPLIEWFAARPIRRTGVRVLLRLRGQRFAVLDELGRGNGSPLARPFAIPPHIRVFHVLGFPRRQDLSDAWAQRGHARLAPLGPNDGGGNLLIDSFKLPGSVHPAFAADHYLRTPAVDSLLLKIFADAAASTDTADTADAAS